MRVSSRPGRTAGPTRAVLLGLLLILALVGTARAHAVVLGSDPLDGAVLAAAPAEMTIQFSEPITLAHAQILGPDGTDVLGPDGARADGADLALALPAAPAQGTYTVSYHVVSLDGHPVAGSIVLSIGRVSGAAQATNASAVWRRAFVAARTFLYLALFGAAGGVIYARLARPVGPSAETTRRIVAGSALGGIAAALATLAAHGGLLMGGTARVLFDPAAWVAGLGSTFGRTTLSALGGLALIAWGSRRTATAEPLRLLGTFVALGGFAFSGHVVTAGPRVLTAPVLLAHVAVTALWVGSLLPLHIALSTPASEAGPLLARFSSLAIRAVPVLILAGLVMAAIQVRRPEALLATEYGRLFLLKMALATALLGLAALNRLRLTPALVRGDRRAPGRLGASILAEIGLVTAILAVTAGLGTTPPPRALVTGTPDETAALREHHGHAARSSERQLHLMSDRFMAMVALAPGAAGANAATLTLETHDGQPVAALEVTLRLSNPDRGIAPLDRPAERDADGRWTVPGLVLGTGGTWTIELDVLVSDFERQTLTATLDLDPAEHGTEGASP